MTIRKTLPALLLSILWPAAALAVDPECEGIVYGNQQPFQGCQWKAGNYVAEFRVCTADTDVDGDPLLPGAYSHCTFDFDGGTQVNTVPVNEPGSLVVQTYTGKNPGHTLALTCTNVDGYSSSLVTHAFCLPGGQPKTPQFLDPQ